MNRKLPAARPPLVTLDDWLTWLEQAHPKKIDLGLERVQQVLRALDLAVPPYRVIAVAGTNGKGSCVSLLEAVYRRAGYRVGTFTSPHLWRFNERIRCDGRDASDAELIETFERIDAARGPVSLSYFEMSTVAACAHFARRRVDVAILEVGMGGRLDAVNAVDADAGLIVSIDLDHQAWLGTDRDAIGAEKAGIMRRGRPIVVADRAPPASVLERAGTIGAALRLLGRDFDFEATAGGLLCRGIGPARLMLPRPGFGGDEQAGNAAACAAVVDALQAVLPVDAPALAGGLGEARLRGRGERHRLAGVEWWFDVAHNPSAAARLREALEAAPPKRRTLAVFGIMADKDITGVVARLAPLVDRWLLAALDSERGAAPAALVETLAAAGARSAHPAGDAAAACRQAAELAEPGDRVLVLGSFYLVGPAMAALGLYCAASERGDRSAKWTGV